MYAAARSMAMRTNVLTTTQFSSANETSPLITKTIHRLYTMYFTWHLIHLGHFSSILILFFVSLYDVSGEDSETNLKYGKLNNNIFKHIFQI